MKNEKKEKNTEEKKVKEQNVKNKSKKIDTKKSNKEQIKLANDKEKENKRIKESKNKEKNDKDKKQKPVKQSENNSKWKKTFIIILSIILFAAIITLAIFLVNRYIQNKDINKLQEVFTETKDEEDNSQDEIKMLKVKELKEENEDIKGWISISDTNISYPLLQSDNDYYMYRNYKKEKNSAGSIFIDEESDLNDVNSNVIIYGHNMKDKTMFQNLMNYKTKEYYEAHKNIEIVSETEVRKYEIIFAFVSRIFYTDEVNVFRYYKTFNFKDEVAYNNYIKNCKKIQLYDTEQTANYGEQLLTLITCDYTRENGRMIVVAKRVN